MPLPDASRLPSLDPSLWTALGQRLIDIGLTRDRAAAVARIAPTLADAVQLPLQQWHLRRSRDAASLAMRMLMLSDPVTSRQAAIALGDLIGPLVEAGFLVAQRDRVASPFHLNVVNDLYILCDDLTQGGSAVMGAGQTTADLCQAAYPSREVGRFLDLGCGAGTAALLFARRARECVGVDINRRAVSLSRVNAALNGVSGVQFREGDLFGPVTDESFDLIVSQPPFVPRPESTEPATFLHGGHRGDELPLRVLRELEHHLAPHGRAVLLVEWALAPDQALEPYVRETLADPSLKLLLLRFPPGDVDDYCARYAAASHPTSRRVFERSARALRSHLKQLGVTELRLAFIVVQRSEGGPAWTSTLDIPRRSMGLVTSARIDRLVESRDLLAKPDESLLDATLRVPDTMLVAERPFATGDPETLCLRFPPESLVQDAQLNPDAHLLLSTVHRTPNVRAAAAAFAAARGLDPTTSTANILEGIREALLKGLLEPTDNEA